MHKKIAVLLISVCCLLFFNTTTSADDTRTSAISIKINNVQDNRYFLCIANVGCLSMLAAKHGKIYRIYHRVEINKLFVADTHPSFRVYPQATPASCKVTVLREHKITISGSISRDQKGFVHIKNLSCHLQ